MAQNVPVKLFVLISGFAIFYSLSAKKQSHMAFLKARCVRTLPSYWIVLALAVLSLPVLAEALAAGPYASDEKRYLIRVIEASRSDMGLHILSHAFMLHGLVPNAWLPDAPTRIAPHLWILSTFWQFYVLAPAIFLLLVNRRLWIVGLIGLAAIASQSTFLTQGLDNVAFFGRFLLYFVVGAASAMAWEASHRHAFKPRVPGFSIAAATIAYLISSDLALTIWIFVAVGTYCVHADSGNPLDRTLARILTGKPSLFLGRVAYQLYLCHFLLLIFPLRLANDWLGGAVAAGWHFGFVFLATLVLSVPTAYALLWLIDDRVAKWINIGRRPKSS